MTESTRMLVRLQVNIIREYFESELGSSISLTAAYNLAARLHGYRSWNEMASKLKTEEKGVAYLASHGMSIETQSRN